MRLLFEQLYGQWVSGRRYPLVPRYNPKLRYTEWMETHPDACTEGHDWTKPRTVLPSHHPCGQHHGHREWRCNTAGCDATFLDPPADETCT